MVNVGGLEGSRSFKQSFKRLKKQGKDMNILFEVAKKIELGELTKNHNDHALKGNLKDFRECHIKPDWVLVYFIKDDGTIFCIDTGSHADIFGM